MQNEMRRAVSGSLDSAETRPMILHILKRAEWEDARRRGDYRPPSLDAEGFIHCSTVDQVLDTANLFFTAVNDLLLLRIDESKLRAQLKYEAPVVTGDARPQTAFPHLYGPLNLDAVVDAIEFPCKGDGSFQLPESIRDSRWN
jgi:uncharacterized protein (DUF952 family)